MSATAKELALRWFEEVWNQQKSSSIDELFDPEGKCYGFPDLNQPIGFEGFKEAHRAFCGAFPDIHIEIEEAVAEGDRVAVRWLATMTHRGDHLGFPASGKQTNFPGSSFVQVKDGKILFGWNYMDIPGLLESLKVAAE